MIRDRSLNAMTLTQIETLLAIDKGRKTFRAREARSVNLLVDTNLVTAEFDISDRDPMRGRVHEIWRNCQITEKGRTVCNEFRDRFKNLM